MTLTPGMENLLSQNNEIWSKNEKIIWHFFHKSWHLNFFSKSYRVRHFSLKRLFNHFSAEKLIFLNSFFTLESNDRFWKRARDSISSEFISQIWIGHAKFLQLHISSRRKKWISMLKNFEFDEWLLSLLQTGTVVISPINNDTNVIAATIIAWNVTYIANVSTFHTHRQCDQIGRFIGLWATF